MSAVREGGKLANQARDLSDVMAPGVITAPPAQGGQQGGAAAGNMPRKFGGADPYDDVMNMRQQLSDGQGKTPFGDLEYTDEVARWQIRKQKIAELAEFDSWFGKNYNVNDLAGRTFAQEVNPEYYSAREREIMTKAKMAAKLKMIQLRGPKNKEDLYMVWLIESGRVVLPPDWDRIGSSGKEAFVADTEKAHLGRGMFRQPRFTNEQQRARQTTSDANPFQSNDPDAAANNAFPFQGTNLGGNKPLSKGPNSVARGFLSQMGWGL